jgi:transposase-like protein
MPRVRYMLPEVNAQPEGRPTSCLYCGGSILQRHGLVPKPIRDLYLHQVIVFRYRCTECGHTFRHYPQGVDSHDQSQRLRALTALLWALGLSHQNISYLLTALGPAIAKITSWRDVQEAGGILGKRPGRTGPIEVIGADETVVKVKGRKMVLGFVVDPATGELLGLDLLMEQDAQAFLNWLRPYVEKHGVQVVVTDDLVTYKPALEELGVEHQVCLAHVRKNVARRLKESEGWVWEKEKIRALMQELPPDGGKELLELEKGVREAPKLRELVVDLCEKWRSLVCCQRRLGVPGTNNRTEQGIGRSKIRYKTLRGYQSVAGMLNGLHLTQWVWRPRTVGDLTALTPSKG